MTIENTLAVPGWSMVVNFGPYVALRVVFT